MYVTDPNTVEPVERERLQPEVLQPGALLQQGGERLSGRNQNVSNSLTTSTSIKSNIAQY